MNCESGDLILEVCELNLTGLLIIGVAGLVELKAHSLEVSNRSVGKWSTDADVTESSRTLLTHKLKLLGCKD